jgi:hypothetical protein
MSVPGMFLASTGYVHHELMDDGTLEDEGS